MNLSQIAKTLALTIQKNSPVILTGVAVTGVITTAVLASRASYVAALKIESEESHTGTAENYMKRIKERFPYVWKLYIPATLSGASTIACIIAAHSIHNRRAAALASAYSLADKALKEYQDKVGSELGEKTKDKIADLVTEDKAKSVTDVSTAVKTGHGSTLCFDTMSSRYFLSSIEHVKRAEIEINRKLMLSMFSSLSEFYDELGLDHTKLSDDMGWEPDNMLKIRYTSMLTDDGTPVMVVDYQTEPRYYR